MSNMTGLFDAKTLGVLKVCREFLFYMLLKSKFLERIKNMLDNGNKSDRIGS